MNARDSDEREYDTYLRYRAVGVVLGKVFCLSVPALILIVCTRKERK